MPRLTTLCLIVCCFVLCAGLRSSADERVVRRLRYPEYDGDGRLKFELTGDEATIQADGLIRIVNAELHFYEEGELVMEMSAPICLFDRENQSAASTSVVQVARGRMTLTGRGFEWSAQEGSFRIFEETKVVLNAEEDDENGGSD